MTFSSIIFIFLFLPVIFVTYNLIKVEYRNILLVLASILFYFWGETYFVIYLIISVIINYSFGFLLFQRRSTTLLTIIVFFNLSLLLYAKYFNFSKELINSIFSFNLSIEKIHLPIGISFFTFQMISYQVDIFRNTIIPQKKLLKLFLYISFFPQLIAGPIVRYIDVQKKLGFRHINISDLEIGTRRFIIGLAKKVLIANPMAIICDSIFEYSHNDLNTSLVWLAMIAYSFQIYYDFSGYSDMAIGLGRVFGFHLNENFNYPYYSFSIQDFWKKWHISLSTWFRDYVYIPLGGNRVSTGRNILNLLIVFFLTGLWHGANVNFIVWGFIHGFFLVLERSILQDILSKISKYIRIIYLLIVVISGWVFFRIENFNEALEILKLMYNFNFETKPISSDLFLTRMNIMIFLAGALFSFPIKNIFKRNNAEISYSILTGKMLTVLKYLSLISIFLYSIMQLLSINYNPFIYFRF